MARRDIYRSLLPGSDWIAQSYHPAWPLSFTITQFVFPLLYAHGLDTQASQCFSHSQNIEFSKCAADKAGNSGEKTTTKTKGLWGLSIPNEERLGWPGMRCLENNMASLQWSYWAIRSGQLTAYFLFYQLSSTTRNRWVELCCG